jgi:aspartate aminotransferase
LYSKEEMITATELVKKTRFVLIADEFIEFTYDGDVHYSVMNIPGLEENAM